MLSSMDYGSLSREILRGKERLLRLLPQDRLRARYVRQLERFIDVGRVRKENLIEIGVDWNYHVYIHGSD